ncbi:MAG: hypothetical protein J6M21_00025 [Campylobacter sp.]|nr:hypothetical protein [Campylobacter sp.]
MVKFSVSFLGKFIKFGCFLNSLNSANLHFCHFSTGDCHTRFARSQ